MNKACTVCKSSYTTKDSRQKTCSKVCADKSRSRWKLEEREIAHRRLVEKPLPPLPLTSSSTLSLPEPEDLPAPYAKRVHDMWVGLMGNDDYRKRIA